MLAHIFLGIVDVPELRPLVLGVPLAKFIAVGEDALLGTGFLFVAAGSADGCVETAFGEGVQQCDGL